MHSAFVGLGANLGPAEASIRAAIGALGALPQSTLVAASRLYRTPAWGREDQPDFINAVAQLRTGLAPLQLLDALLGIEQAFGRERRAGERWGPRTLDLDLLLYADQVLDLPRLQVPHPHLHARAFALLPLAELAPEAIIPGHGTVQHALRAIDACGLEPIG
ncbi:2-amino-4-hydroxy-6-hydroxymethyldihydropteridine diphosphokinase [Xanthomonas melonis]|uniref:2-amino-4-hydroxy-6-hydroxymethyldihydropteridine pyrophosphokinase n=1 Tax=Xanthomonas melonis TaxID=56456 RepID=A0A2S7DJX1_9XANT|nr:MULTISPECIES: 2-amino-4-hydroxy-6-hydroxymethyldihydropteridine diphosphokinase [Xanthomonas]MCC4588868.1 2-amino-4-hydroxy-6-hydroxymethyldihydropteridine diphosphokinase [Xanthomonas sp. NCPPB 1067]MCC4599791.1 2-amino-4-hydroxy-6-hydroxymethyldihydropteridine diphosphokinase [Xanthomonas melonis]MCD0246338.1 2-amino-4-hydroxy-6-hydroxymethyldihydropteridine diphosphokinase [Xanthomonas melonis]MCD0258769.1 2-amino-4-hydroxy-6-hydroxymethyldihydropteridine diphosphokinase [Xanthomonas melo